MKAGKEHRVPLSDRAAEILARMAEIRSSDFVFPGRGGRPLGGAAFQQQLRAMGRTDVTAHGFRSAFRDWAAEQTHAPAEVAEMALGHAVSNAVETAYRRGDLFEKRRQLAGTWARYCAGGEPLHDQRLLLLPTNAVAAAPT